MATAMAATAPCSCRINGTTGWCVRGPSPAPPGLEHRIGGIEKDDITGNVWYDPANHEHMVKTRAQKIANIANEIPQLTVTGPEDGDLLVIGWGGTYGAILTAVQRCSAQGTAGGPCSPAISQSHAAKHRRRAASAIARCWSQN